MNCLRIVCVCGQSGAAAALLPVLRMGVNKYGWVASVKTYGEASSVFVNSGFTVETCGAEFSEAASIDWLNSFCPDVVLVGSDAGRHVEKHVIRAAARIDVPSIMFVDFWSNYTARFIDKKGAVLPDAVAVLDTKMAEDLITQGIPGEHIYVTGSPALGQAVIELETYDEIQRVRLRRQVGVEEEEICVLFISTPGTKEDYGDEPLLSGQPHSLFTIVEDVIESLTHSVLLDKKKIHLFIRPHPRESVSSFKGLMSEHLRVSTSRESRTFDALIIADLVIGLDSVLLIEALMAGQKILCLDYVRSLNESVRLLADSTNVLVKTPDLLLTMMEHCLTSGKNDLSQSQYALVNGATERLVKLVMNFGS